MKAPTWDAASAHRVEAHRHGDPQKRALVQSLLQAKHVPHDLALPTPLYSLVGVHLLDAATRTRLAPTARLPEGGLTRRGRDVLQVELEDVVESASTEHAPVPSLDQQSRLAPLVLQFELGLLAILR